MQRSVAPPGTLRFTSILGRVGGLLRSMFTLGSALHPSYALSSLVAASATGTADGSTGNTLTLTVYDTNGVLMAGQAVTFTTELTAVSASQSTLVDDAAEIAATTGTLNLILVCKDANGVALPNIASARIVFASTGSNNTFGTPSVTDKNGQSLCTFSSTTAEAKTISVTVDGVAVTQTAAVTVTAGAPAAPAFVFTSDYRTATGTSAAALRDTDQTIPWASTSGASGEVVAASGNAPTGWPTTNVLKVPNVFFRPVSPDIGVPGAAGVRVFRWYFSAEWDDTPNDSQTHPIESFGSDNWGFTCHHPDGVSTWRCGLQFIGESFANSLWYSPNLAKSTTYRFEYRFDILTVDGGTDTATCNAHVRIYDADDVLLYSDADFVDRNEGSRYLSVTPTLTLYNYSTAFNVLFWGTNDPVNSTMYAYEGGLAISDEDWCGAYQSGETT